MIQRCKLVKRLCLVTWLLIMAILLSFHVSEMERLPQQCCDHEVENLKKMNDCQRQSDEMPTKVYSDVPKKSVVHTRGLPLFIQSVLLDDRFQGDIVRVFGLEIAGAETPEFVCRTKSNGSHDVTLEVPAPKAVIDPTWPHWSTYFAVLFDCHFPRGTRPTMIEFESKDRAILFTLPVEYPSKKTPRKTLGICVKPVSGNFQVSRLVEWFEMHRLAGVEDFIIYIDNAQGAMQFVLGYYRSLGIVTEILFPYLTAVLQYIDASPEAMTPEIRYAVYQQIYLVAYQDCLLRFHGFYENMLFIDLDEVLLPASNVSLVDMTRTIRQSYGTGAGFLFMTAWHFEELLPADTETSEPYLYMQRYIYATLPLQVQPKSIVATDIAITVNFHSILNVPEHHYSNELMPWETVGYIHHFRGTCKNKFDKSRCEEFMKDTRLDPIILKYKPHVEKNVRRVLDIIQIN